MVALAVATRLERLEREGLITKPVESTMPPRTRYELTAGGVALQGVIDAIDAWGRAHLANPETPAGASGA
jgi:DNA-binding HxlR family transcriptional regulator